MVDGFLVVCLSFLWLRRENPPIMGESEIAYTLAAGMMKLRGFAIDEVSWKARSCMCSTCPGSFFSMTWRGRSGRFTKLALLQDSIFPEAGWKDHRKARGDWPLRWKIVSIYLFLNWTDSTGVFSSELWRMNLTEEAPRRRSFLYFFPDRKPRAY